MPVTLKAANMKYKSEETGEYVGINTVSDKATAEQILAIHAAGAEQIESIEQYDSQYVDEAIEARDDAVAAKNSAQAAAAQAQAALMQDVSTVLSTLITNPDSPPLDRTLTQNSAAAPSDIVGNVNKSIKLYESDVCVSFVSGYYNIAPVGEETSEAVSKSTTGVVCGQIQCIPGDIFQVSLGGSGNSQGGGARAYAFLDEDRITISTADRNQELVDEFIVAPPDAKYLIVNTRTSASPTSFNYEYYAVAGDRISQRINTKADKRITGTTDNLFDIIGMPADCTNLDENTVFGTVDKLRYVPLISVNNNERTEYTFEWDYMNTDYNQGTSGPCVIGMDGNGDLVQVTSGTTGETATSVELRNYSSFVHRSFSVIFPSETRTIAFGKHGYTTGLEIYTFRNIKIRKSPSETVRKFDDYYPNMVAVDNIARETAKYSGFLHDGAILRMASDPDAIPVDENHIGYNEFILRTWETLLPDNYVEGEAYNATRTKICNVKVERASRWTSTPYGANMDTYTIRRYIFTPQNGYEKTVLLTSGCHGNEAEAYWGLFRLIRMIYFEGYKYPTLRNLRNVRFIVIPSWNPWGMQHYRRYNAFSALNTGSYDYAKGLQAWNWLYEETHKKTVEGVVYDISDVGEANVIWETINEFKDALSLWIDFHTDPYAGRSTEDVDIDDPRGYEDPYGCYGYSAIGSKTYCRMCNVIEDYKNIFRDEYSFDTTYHAMASEPGDGFTSWQATLGFPCALVEISTFMNDFPYASGSAEMMKIAQEYYGNCIAELLR